MAEQNKNAGRQEAPRVNFRPGGRGPGGPMGGRMNAEKPKNAGKTFSRLARYIGKSKFALLGIVLLTVVIAFADLVGPKLQQLAIDTITVTDGVVKVDFQAMLTYIAIMSGFFVFSALLTLIQERIAVRLSTSTVYFMRRELFEKLERLPIKYTDTHRHGDIMSRMTNDIDNVSSAISQSLTSLFSGVITIIGAVVMMLKYSVGVTLVAVITIPLTIIVSSMLAKFMRKYFIRQQTLLGQLNGQVEEMVTGYTTVISYGKEPEAVEKFAAISDDFRRCSVSARVWGSIMGPVMNFIGNLQYVLVAGFGGFLMLRGGSITVGSIQAMLQYSKKLSRPINMIANQYSSILTALAGAERIFDILDTPNEIDEGKSAVTPAEIHGNVDFSDICFSYVEGEPVLKNLTLSVKPGQKIAIVLQDTVLFSDTIRSNIKYGRLDASDDDMKRAAATARADTFIERLPEGYDTVLAESGSNLSEGQRQLLAIARAVLADPKILILDEATSSVDTRTEMHIQSAMAELMKNRTSLIIAHRLSTIRNADVIVVLSHGEIVETGNHDELLAKGGEYSKLYESQFAGIAT